MKRPASFSYEEKFWKSGLSLVAGVDEVGRGAWAGPLYAAAVVFPPSVKLPFFLYDSKVLTPTKRAEIADAVKRYAFAFAYGIASVSLIERYGLTYATDYAMRSALEHLGLKPDFVLVDFFRVRSLTCCGQEAIKFGDRLSASIAAASILAKVERDFVMGTFDKIFPAYGFGRNKGYGTKGHQEAIQKFGTVAIHRESFIPKAIKGTQCIKWK